MPNCQSSQVTMSKCYTQLSSWVIQKHCISGAVIWCSSLPSAARLLDLVIQTRGNPLHACCSYCISCIEKGISYQQHSPPEGPSMAGALAEAGQRHWRKHARVAPKELWETLPAKDWVQMLATRNGENTRQPCKQPCLSVLVCIADLLLQLLTIYKQAEMVI